MRFYYFSLFSWIAYGVVVSVAIVLLWLVWTKLLTLPLKNPVYWLFVAAILVAPWSEELWIAYRFDQLCRKDAGLMIKKTVKVDGFYDDTGVLTRLVGRPYEFVESPDGQGRYKRIERASKEEKAKALAWYSGTHPGLAPPRNAWITQPISDRVRVVVEPDTGHAWHITTIDQPTARYWYKRVDNHTRVAHQIRRFQNAVFDSQTGELLARYMEYTRGPYWFFIGLDAPSIECVEAKGKDPISYRAALRPVR